MNGTETLMDVVFIVLAAFGYFVLGGIIARIAIYLIDIEEREFAPMAALAVIMWPVIAVLLVGYGAYVLAGRMWDWIYPPLTPPPVPDPWLTFARLFSPPRMHQPASQSDASDAL